jgi:hypothetical protein
MSHLSCNRHKSGLFCLTSPFLEEFISHTPYDNFDDLRRKHMEKTVSTSNSSEDVWARIQQNLANVKTAGVQLVGENLPPTYTRRKPRHVPEPGKTWTAWLQTLNKEVITS